MERRFKETLLIMSPITWWNLFLKSFYFINKEGKGVNIYWAKCLPSYIFSSLHCTYTRLPVVQTWVAGPQGLSSSQLDDHLCSLCLSFFICKTGIKYNTYLFGSVSGLKDKIKVKCIEVSIALTVLTISSFIISIGRYCSRFTDGRNGALKSVIY